VRAAAGRRSLRAASERGGPKGCKAGIGPAPGTVSYSRRSVVTTRGRSVDEWRLSSSCVRGHVMEVDGDPLYWCGVMGIAAGYRTGRSDISPVYREGRLLRRE
jgi:hypothetical protein